MQRKIEKYRKVKKVKVMKIVLIILFVLMAIFCFMGMIAEKDLKQRKTFTIAFFVLIICITALGVLG